jgi:hypothetical protein
MHSFTYPWQEQYTETKSFEYAWYEPYTETRTLTYTWHEQTGQLVTSRTHAYITGTTTGYTTDFNLVDVPITRCHGDFNEVEGDRSIQYHSAFNIVDRPTVRYHNDFNQVEGAPITRLHFDFNEVEGDPTTGYHNDFNVVATARRQNEYDYVDEVGHTVQHEFKYKTINSATLQLEERTINYSTTVTDLEMYTIGYQTVAGFGREYFQIPYEKQNIQRGLFAVVCGKRYFVCH